MTTISFITPKSRSFDFFYVAVAPVLALFLAIVSILDLLSLHNVVNSPFVLGQLSIDWSVFPAMIILLVVFRARDLRFQLSHRRAFALGIFFGLFIAIFAYYIQQTTSPGDALAYLLLGLKEEAVYRVAVPVSIGFLMAFLGVNPRISARIAIGSAAIVFATLPGHLAQISSPIEVFTFIAFALIMTYFVWDTQTVILAGLLHAAINAVTDLVAQDYFDPRVRVALVFVMIMALVSALPHAGEKDEDPEREDGVVIDLRDHVIATDRHRHHSAEAQPIRI